MAGPPFLQVSHLLFLDCAQTSQAHCTYVWRHEDVKAQCEDNVAIRSIVYYEFIKTCLPKFVTSNASNAL